MSEANEITAALLDEIPKRFYFIRVWRNNRVKAMAVGRGGRMRMVNAGIDGQADITGLAAVVPRGTDKPIGVRLEVEVKAPRDRQSEDQKAFERMIEQLGGIYILARDVTATLKEIERRLGIL